MFSVSNKEVSTPRHNGPRSHARRLALYLVASYEVFFEFSPPLGNESEDTFISSYRGGTPFAPMDIGAQGLAPR